jgi:hypothetical protein
MICTVMEARMGMQYPLLWQGLLSCELLSAPILSHTPSIKSGMAGLGQYSRLAMRSLDRRTNSIVTQTLIINLLAGL